MPIILPLFFYCMCCLFANRTKKKVTVSRGWGGEGGGAEGTGVVPKARKSKVPSAENQKLIIIIIIIYFFYSAIL